MNPCADCDRAFEPHQPYHRTRTFQEAAFCEGLSFLEGPSPTCSASGDTSVALTNAAADLTELLAVGGQYHA